VRREPSDRSLRIRRIALPIVLLLIGDWSGQLLPGRLGRVRLGHAAAFGDADAGASFRDLGLYRLKGIPLDVRL
jgi:hypothetical protein